VQIWGFVSPGLFPHERGYVVPFLLLSSVSFIGGAALLTRLSFRQPLDNLLGLGEDFRLLLKADDYFDFIIIIMLGMGVIFQMPAVTYVLARNRHSHRWFSGASVEDFGCRYPNRRGCDFADQRYSEHDVVCRADARFVRGFDRGGVDFWQTSKSVLVGATKSDPLTRRKDRFHGVFAHQKGNETLVRRHLDCVLGKPLESVTLGQHQRCYRPG